MSALELVAAVSGPAGLLLGVVGKGWLERKLTQAAADGMEAESNKTYSESGKFDAEAAQVIAATTVTLLRPLQAEIADLRTRIETLEAENTYAQGKVRRAVHYIKDLLKWIAEHVPDGSPPLPPSDLDI